MIFRTKHICKTLLQSKFLYPPTLRSLVPLQSLHTAHNMPCKEVSALSDGQVADWFNSFDTVMTDCDGVLWVGADAIPGSPDMIKRFRDLGKRVFYVTNNSTKHRREYKTKVDKLGFGGDLDEIVGTAYLAAAYLEQVGFDKNKLVYVVGSTGITQELDDVGIKYLPIGVSNSLSLDSSFILSGLKDLGCDLSAVGALVFGYTSNFTYYDILLANAVLANPACLFLLEAPDVTLVTRTDLGTKMTIPCTGSMVAAVSTAAGRKPIVLGKPSKFMFEIVQKRHPGIQPERTLMIGDRANTDILLGKNCGLQTLLVGSGVHSLAETRAWEVSEDGEERRMVADFYADKLGDLLDRVKAL
eukprot:GFUD01086320.1.p1 GENE.GFUD01086320.1~~GFUD01086320.1.p1  ORF type:complete len:357 (+),score=63.24 GFUD01086320.1:44-1114(+)